MVRVRVIDLVLAFCVAAPTAHSEEGYCSAEGLSQLQRKGRENLLLSYSSRLSEVLMEEEHSPRQSKIWTVEVPATKVASAGEESTVERPGVAVSVILEEAAGLGWPLPRWAQMFPAGLKARLAFSSCILMVICLALWQLVQAAYVEEDAQVAQQTVIVRQTPLSEVLFGAALALTYIAMSSCMILFMKFLMHPGRFPYAVCLTAMHILSTLTLSLCLFHLAPELFPSFAAFFCKQQESQSTFEALRPFAPVGILSAASIVLSNVAYLHADVCFLQVVKEGSAVWVYLASVLFGLDILRLRTVVVLGFVVISAIVAVRGASPTTFTLLGLGIQLTASVAQALSLVMQNKMMVRQDGLKIDPMTMVLCIAPVMLAMLLPATCVFWDPKIPSSVLEWWPYLLANVLLAFLLQICMAVTVKYLSATGHALASVAKDLAICGAARLLMHETLTSMQLGGFLGSIAGISFYSVMKMFPAWFDRT